MKYARTSNTNNKFFNSILKSNFIFDFQKKKDLSIKLQRSMYICMLHCNIYFVFFLNTF